MANEDVVRSKETKAAIEEAEKQKEANAQDEANRKLVDAAREQMKAVLSGGLQLDEERMDDEEASEPTTLDDAFGRIQSEMRRQFSSRLNTDEQNEDIAALQQGKRIYETFELIPGEEDADGNLKPNGRPPFAIKFQSINSDEEVFINQVALRNGVAIRNGAEIEPRYDEDMRMEMLLAFSTVALGGDVITPPSIEDMYAKMEQAAEDGEEEVKTITLSKKLQQIQNRLGAIRRRLPMGTYSTAAAALGVWAKYQRDLVSPMRIANFSTPPSERS